MEVKGSEWLRAGKTAVLKVPSAIVHEEHNYVLNPAHPDFGLIHIVERKPFAFDPRIKQML